MLRKSISAGVIIYRKTSEGLKFLILYHGGTYWNFPKGRIESEERSFETAIREVFEETGIRAKEMNFNRNFKAYERFVTTIKGERVLRIVILYLAETRQAHVRLKPYGHEEGYGWFTYKDALKILGKHEGIERILRNAYSFLMKKSRSSSAISSKRESKKPISSQ